jgi:uncharacterized protein (TIGR03067 family)
MAGKGMEIVLGPNDIELIGEFTGRKWLLGTAAKRVEKAEIVALDPTTDPKCIDLKSLEKARDGDVYEAIYQMDGDTLIICLYQGKGKQRPTSFENPKDQDTVMVVMKRVKE